MTMEQGELQHESCDEEMVSDESSDGYIESETEEENESDSEGDAVNLRDDDEGVEDGGEGVQDDDEGGIGKDEVVLDVNNVIDQNVEAEEKNEIKKKRKRKPKDSSKLPPQRQKKLIHTLLKKAKIYEIRKLTRRINVLKASKGTAEQQAKKLRKAERLVKEIEAIREFMIDELTNRTVDAFKGRSEEVYNKMWESCQDPIKANDMLQVLSNKESENSKDIAYFRMLSSKDIVGKFQRIAMGENLSAQFQKQNDEKPENQGVKSSNKLKPKNETKTRKSNDKKGHLNKREIVEKIDVGEKLEVENKKTKRNDRKGQTTEKATNEGDVSNEPIEVDKENTVKTKKKDKSDKPKKIEEEKKAIKASKDKKVKTDDFFMGDSVQFTDDELSTESDNEEEEFTAPVKKEIQNPDIIVKKKNRMGQRDRKRLQDIKHKRVDPRQQSFRGRGRGRDIGGRGRDVGGRGARGGRGRDISHGKKRFNDESKFELKQKPPVVKTVDESLHPSWQAKQKQKFQQGIADFAGTKITFDD